MAFRQIGLLGCHFYSICVIFVANRKIVAIFESVLELKEKKGRMASVSKNKVDNGKSGELCFI